MKRGEKYGMPKKHIVVLMGGASSEHDVSLRTGAQIVKGLEAAVYDVTPVVITRQGLWAFPEGEPLQVLEALQRIKQDADCVLLALHGAYGEDGRLQGMFDLLEVPYVGSGSAASALALDKIHAKAVVQQHGLRVGRQYILHEHVWRSQADNALAAVEAELGFPCVAKSPLQGSSLGMAIPKDAAALREALPTLFELDKVVLVEEYLKGTEVTCAVLDVGPEGARPLPVTEIRPVTAEYFDYIAKYTPGATLEVTPAEIPKEQALKVQEMAVRAHQVIGCRHLSRSDMILVDGEPVWIEINTFPGMTQTSLYPQAAAAAGISFSELMVIFIDAAMGV
jgi:D-alanine-D-alanine ligase